MNNLYFLAQQMMFFSVPLLIVALGGMFSERSGVVNIALEGIMVMGAFCSILFLNLMQKVYPGNEGALVWVLFGAIAAILIFTACVLFKKRARAGGIVCGALALISILCAALFRERLTPFMAGNGLLLLAILIAAASGMLFSLLHAYASINMRADQTISGTALNMIAPAFAIYMARTIQPNGVQQVEFIGRVFQIKSVPLLGDIPVLGPLLFQNTYITTYIGFLILALSAFVLYKTRFGLRLRACGEHPQAADSVGVNVYRIRYAGVAISGALAGLGGLVFVVPTSTNFNATVSGYGFLALAVLIFGQWKPLRIFLAALFFGLMKTIAASYSGISILKGLPIPSDIYKMIPYIATMIVLAFSSRKSQGPRASGVPYDKGSR